MIVEMALSGKCLFAGKHFAVVRSFTSMQTKVSLEVTLLIECFLAVFIGAHEVFNALVLLKMHFQPVLS